VERERDEPGEDVSGGPRTSRQDRENGGLGAHLSRSVYVIGGRDQRLGLTATARETRVGRRADGAARLFPVG